MISRSFPRHVLAFLALSAVMGCETISSQPPIATTAPRTASDGAPADSIEAALAAGLPSLMQTYRAEVGKDPYVYLLGHIAWQNRRCHDFFDQLQRSFTNQRFAQDQIGLGSGTAAATAALAGATTNALAGIGIGTSLLQGTLSNYGKANFLEPEPAVVYALIKKAHVRYLDTNKTSLTAIGNTASDDSRSIAINTIKAQELAQGYSEICSRENIARLVNDALEKGEVTTASPNSDGIARQFVSAAVGWPLTLDQASLIYWAVVEKQGVPGQAERAGLEAELGPDLVASILSDPRLRQVLSVDLVAGPLRNRGLALAAAFTAPAAGPAPSPAPTPSPAPSPSPSGIESADDFAAKVFGPTAVIGTPVTTATPPAPVARQARAPRPITDSSDFIRPTILSVE